VPDVILPQNIGGCHVLELSIDFYKKFIDNCKCSTYISHFHIRCMGYACSFMVRKWLRVLKSKYVTILYLRNHCTDQIACTMPLYAYG
jgi:hypothetical protein